MELKELREKVVCQDSRRVPPSKRKLTKKRPTLKGYQKLLIAKLRQRWPWITHYNRFTPETFINWLQTKARRAHAKKVEEGTKNGRPSTPTYVIDAILAIKRQNLRYTAGHIARMISGGELKYQISKNTVAKILKQHGFKPRPKGKRPPREKEQGWIEALHNQFIMAIDFKCAYDMRGNQLFIFNLIDHGRRVLYWSRATYNPTSGWVAQQLRNAFMDLDTLPEAIVMDRDSTFQPIVKETLPNMGIKPIRIGYKSPWQNAVVERFHRTLVEELLRYVQPFSDRHLNRLLTEYRQYYNTARPHMSNEGEAPVEKVIDDLPAVNDPDYFQNPRKLVRKKWLGGLHSSYRWTS
ncbi:hypothetical protein AVO41_01205 [Thiomicrospira sp. WB1]|nr:hypothetical protein AVO41_01205 [Thiomicrospira sp. WB1]